MNNLKIRLFMFTALVCGVFFLTNCGGGATTGGNNTAAKNDAPKNTATTTTTNTTTTTTNTTTTTEAPKNTDVASTESFGVPECDDYVKKYEACLTKIAKDAPQAQPGLKTAFEGQRSAIKQAVSTPQGKTMMATQCKQYAENAKQATTAYSCSW